MIKRAEIPELMCFVASIVFIALTIPITLFWKPNDVGIISMPLYFGLFMFLLCMVLTSLRKNDELKDRVKKLEQQSKPEVEHE